MVCFLILTSSCCLPLWDELEVSFAWLYKGSLKTGSWGIAPGLRSLSCSVFNYSACRDCSLSEMRIKCFHSAGIRGIRQSFPYISELLYQASLCQSLLWGSSLLWLAGCRSLVLEDLGSCKKDIRGMSNPDCVVTALMGNMLPWTRASSLVCRKVRSRQTFQNWYYLIWELKVVWV